MTYTIGQRVPSKSTPEQRAAMVAAMKRIFSSERLTYTDKEMDLVMLGWQSELEKFRARAIKVCQDWIDDHAAADNCTYANCDMVAAVTDVMEKIKELK